MCFYLQRTVALQSFQSELFEWRAKLLFAKFKRVPDNLVMKSGSAPAALVTRGVTKPIEPSPATNTGSPNFQLHLLISTDATFGHSMGAPPLQLTASAK